MGKRVVMRFARRVFVTAGIWGLLVVPPLYFLFDTIGRQNPPAITHPEYYYGFTSVTLAWQFAFFVIASDPARFRPLMPPAIAEKLTNVRCGAARSLRTGSRRFQPARIRCGG